MTDIALRYIWNPSCQFCARVKKYAATAFVSLIAFTEDLGAARAAGELARMGQHDAAKQLMLDRARRREQKKRAK